MISGDFDMVEQDLRLGRVILWVVFYIGTMFISAFLNVLVWEKVFDKRAALLDFITKAVCVGIFVVALDQKGRKLAMFRNVSLTGILAAIGCAVLLFLVTDKCVDPFLARLFPQSEGNYQDAVRALKQTPVISALQVCILAPLVEEALMRGFALDGMKRTYGAAVALILSSVIFALLHFNMVQTLSALLCGIVLGALYLKTGSLFCCMLAHGGYNLISYVAIMREHPGL